MQSVGFRLREARVKSGLSLDDINAHTRISVRNLSAIETDDVHGISSPFLYRSFVRQFAEIVGLEFSGLSSSVEVAAGQMRQPDLPGQGEHQIVRVAPIQARPKRDWSWIMPVLVLVGIVVLGSGGFAFLKYFTPAAGRLQSVSSLSFHRSSSPATSTQAVSSQAAAPRAVSPKTSSSQTGRLLTQIPKIQQRSEFAAEANSVKNSNSSARSAEQDENAPLIARNDSGQDAVKATPKITQEESPVSPDRIHLELAATERTWLSVSADGKTAYTGILEPAETKVLDSKESARLRTGNAGGVNIIFNGKPIGSIGPSGRTRTVVFSKTGFEIEPAERVTLSRSNHIGG